MEEAHDALEEATILPHSRKARGALNRVYYAEPKTGLTPLVILDCQVKLLICGRMKS